MATADTSGSSGSRVAILPLCKIISGTFISIYLPTLRCFSSGPNNFTSRGMTTQVSRQTMPIDTTSACSTGGRPPIRGARILDTRILTGQTPRTVMIAIFQRGGALVPSVSNQYSSPRS